MPMNARLALALAALMGSSFASAGPITLAAALEHARAHDPQWSAAQHTHQASRELAPIARAGLLPSLNSSLGRERTTFEPDGFSSNTSNSTTWGLEARQPLFSLSAWHDYQAAKAGTNAADAQLRSEEQAFLIRVVQTYFDVLRAQVILDTRKAEEAAVGRQLEQTRQRFNVGLVPKTDVLEAEAGYNLTVVGRIAADTQLQVARRTLASLTHQPIDGVADLADNAPLVSPAPDDPSHWVEQARSHNAELSAASQAEAVANARYKSARADHLPTVALRATYGDASGVLYNPQTPESDVTTKTLGVALTLPLYNGGAVSAARRQSLNEWWKARDNVQYARQSAELAAANLFELVSNHLARVEAYRKSIRSAEAALTATEAGYQAGTRTIVDVLGAQKSLFAARSDLANARYDYVVDSVRLKQAAGVLSDADLLTLNTWLAASQAGAASGQ